MNHMTRNSIIAVVLLVVLRLAIGWQLMYEGVWKLDTLDSAKPWSSVGYLKNAEGPLRDTFRSMAGDPDDLDWLNYEIVAKRWDEWAQRFKASYGLSESQSKTLDRILNGASGDLDGRPVYAAELAALPEGVSNLKEAARVSDKNVWYDAERKRIYVDGRNHLKDVEYAKLLKIVDGQDDEVSKAYREAVEKVFIRQKRGIGYKEKLAGALAAFDLEVNGLTCVDIGASTGGFTDCLLQAGAASVTAIDVGYGQLDSGLRNDSRVHTLERTNARRIDCDLLAAAPDVITCDVSFISFRLVVPPVVICARAGWRALILVKPQFEAGRADVGKGGVVRDPAIHQRVLVDACAWVEDQGWTILGLDVSDLVGAKGNREFFLLLSDGSVQSGLDVHKSIEMCVGS